MKNKLIIKFLKDPRYFWVKDNLKGLETDYILIAILQVFKDVCDRYNLNFDEKLKEFSKSIKNNDVKVVEKYVK